MQVHADAQAATRRQIPPLVLPELLANAVTHNDFTTDNSAGDGVGLEYLAQRFRLTTGVAARWAETGGRFVVTLPLVASGGSNIAQ